MRMDCLPRWLLEWGKNKPQDTWDHLQNTADAMWAIGCAVVLTAIWRRRIEVVHPELDGRILPQQQAALSTKKQIMESYRRYRLGLFPLARRTYEQLGVVDGILARFVQDNAIPEGPVGDGVTRVCFFDGGSRGNPGAGGSGSIIAEYDGEGKMLRPAWAAATV
ncbi:hypothetical protein V7S43_009993 [Phytophthora oleae]|uniref:Uncharacterized protein n=1 Tax=Phytophthora oleae TaxID=2107226 RepID=A0ABD3FDM7_9STRA